MWAAAGANRLDESAGWVYRISSALTIYAISALESPVEVRRFTLSIDPLTSPTARCTAPSSVFLPRQLASAVIICTSTRALRFPCREREMRGQHCRRAGMHLSTAALEQIRIPLTPQQSQKADSVRKPHAGTPLCSCTACKLIQACMAAHSVRLGSHDQ